MPSPRRGQKFCPSGGAIYAGMSAPGPVGLPLWAAEAPLNTLIEIPNTVHPMRSGSRYPVTESYSGMALTADGEIITGPSGGHSDGEDNPVYGLRLMVDVPAWQQRCAPSSSLLPYEQPYYTGGKPAARHIYWSIFHVPATNRIMLVGCYSTPTTSSGSFPIIDGFNLNTNEWDPPGTYAYLTTGSYAGPTDGVYPVVGSDQGTMIDADGFVWTLNASKKYDTANDIVSAGAGGDTTAATRAPWVDCPARGLAFGICYGDGQGSSTFLGANAYKRVGSTLTKITFNASAGLSQFLADGPVYLGLDYDPINDEFVAYSGVGSQAGRFFVIKPNATNVWDISVRTFAGTIAATHTSGLASRFHYVPALKGFVILPDKLHGVYYVRTA